MSPSAQNSGRKRPVTVESVTTTVLGSGAGAAPTPPSDPARDPNLVRVFDGYGRELFVPRAEWRERVLVHRLQEARDDPEALGQVIRLALDDGFLDEVIEPAEHLAAIDPIPERAAILLAGVYFGKKRFDEAERVLRRSVERSGETGTLLANLAEIEAERGDGARALATAWRALELDPNLDNAFARYLAGHADEGNPANRLAALQRIAALPGSWRARLWLARAALEHRALDEALALYREALALAGAPVPADLLGQMSADLGNAAHLPELLELAAPRFDVAFHGLAVGNNLLKANLDLGRLDAARVLLDRLYAQQRPDWKAALDHWDGELAKARVGTAAFPADAKLVLAMLHGDGPVWLPADSAAAELFPTATGERVQLAFLGSSGETGMEGERIQAGLADGPGRLARALPLFLAEQTYFGAGVQVRPLVPWVRGDTSAFVFCAVPWSDEEAARHARGVEPPADYVVATHLRAVAEPWRVELRLIRAIDGRVCGTAAADFPVARPEAALRRLAADLLQLLHQETGLELSDPPANYQVPAGPGFGFYLLGLEKLLAVRCHAADPASVGDLHGERGILDSQLHFCLAEPGHLVPRLVLAQTLKRMAAIRPTVVAEYREKVAWLQHDRPLPAPAQGVLQRLFAEVFPPRPPAGGAAP